MSFNSPIEDAWLINPPNSLVVGGSPYHRTLSWIFSATEISHDNVTLVSAGFKEDRLPQVLRDLKRVIIVTDSPQSPEVLIYCHNEIWKCLEKLSPDGDQHELVTLFVVPPGDQNLIESLLLYWGISATEASNFGLGFARLNDSLESFCRTIAAIKPMDLLPLKARQSSNVRHKSIRHLLNASTVVDLTTAAKQVAELFEGCEYHLDLYCNAPAHQNGNRLRQILREIVTGSVTPDDYPDRIKEISRLLK